jgi:hypothetical protein
MHLEFSHRWGQRRLCQHGDGHGRFSFNCGPLHACYGTTSGRERERYLRVTPSSVPLGHAAIGLPPSDSPWRTRFAPTRTDADRSILSGALVPNLATDKLDAVRQRRGCRRSAALPAALQHRSQPGSNLPSRNSRLTWAKLRNASFPALQPFGSSFERITSAHCRNYFRKAGYASV